MSSQALQYIPPYLSDAMALHDARQSLESDETPWDSEDLRQRIAELMTR